MLGKEIPCWPRGRSDGEERAITVKATQSPLRRSRHPNKCRFCGLPYLITLLLLNPFCPSPLSSRRPEDIRPPCHANPPHHGVQNTSPFFVPHILGSALRTVSTPETLVCEYSDTASLYVFVLFLWEEHAPEHASRNLLDGRSTRFCEPMADTLISFKPYFT